MTDENAKYAAQNLEVLCFQFGAYPRGTVIPGYLAARAGSVAEMIAREQLRPTHLPATIDLAAVKDEPAKTAEAEKAAEELYARAHKAEADAKRLADANDLLVLRGDSLEQQIAARDAQLGVQAAAVEHLKAEYAKLVAAKEAAAADLAAARGVADRQRSEIDALKGELDAATAPPAKPGPAKDGKKTTAAA